MTTSLHASASASSPVDGVGARIALFRRVAEMTQDDLARVIGKSTQWLASVEQGRAPVSRLSDIINIASALGCSVADLIGRPVDATTPGAPGGAALQELLDTVRLAVMTSAVRSSGARHEPLDDADTITARTSELWAMWHAASNPHVTVGRHLPALITDAADLTVASPDRPAYAAMAEAMAITRQWLHHVTPEPTLTYVVAERGLSAARAADDPLLVALGAWGLSASYRRLGQPQEATALCVAAADEAQRILAASTEQSPRLLAAVGMLNLAASISAAQSSDDGKAWYLHGIADAIAGTLGDFQDPWTVFGRPNVAIHALAIKAELGDADGVVDLARRVDVDSAASTERRSAAFIDVARGFFARGEEEAAVRALLQGEAISPDRIRQSPLAREIVRAMLLHDRVSVRADVRALATRCRIIPGGSGGALPVPPTHVPTAM